MAGTEQPLKSCRRMSPKVAGRRGQYLLYCKLSKKDERASGQADLVLFFMPSDK
jgi:hypothetical protein